MTITHRDQLGTVLNELNLTGEGVEVGVGWGAYSEILLKSWKGYRLWMVDPLKPMPDYNEPETNTPERHARCREALQRLIPRHSPMAVWLPITSEAATSMFKDGSIDFIYLDGNHDLHHISSDLAGWYPKLKRGGVFAGHDYYDKVGPQQCCHVKSALDNWMKDKPVTLHTTEDTSWWLIKP